ncbi:unnamed protein product [Brassicogethes aeneus]|uniref:Thrombospondin-like N-terminal domain-containing protein n=1 Tax=Brassicogethes aeneus TaxID=1431903 RepID=A0A9P0FLS0_BRAAE|nr:unnamed protein product [Brassicogethes aeneus]
MRLFVAITFQTLLISWTAFGCDLERFHLEKQVSVEENAASADIVFRGFRIAVATPPSNDLGGVRLSAYFNLVNTYKGVDQLKARIGYVFRQINVTFVTRPSTECIQANDIPREYIIFANVVDDNVQASSMATWDENTDERIWKILGWSKWSEWTACSVSCSSGIQQRFRRCRSPKCSGFNVEQRHCNLFGCDGTLNPLALKEEQFYHPSKDRWKKVADRPTAWKLRPNSYIWIPSSELVANQKQIFPRDFTLFITLRVEKDAMGTIFSLRSRNRQDSYLSLEVSGSDLKLIHAASNGTDFIRIPTKLIGGQWHQIAISIRDESVVNSYSDCEWLGTDILKAGTLKIPENSDVIVGYLFTGDLEQLLIVSNPDIVNLQCSRQRTPITDQNL